MNMDTIDLTYDVKPKSKAGIIAGHQSLAGMFTDMVAGLASGDSVSVIKYINRATVKTDCEAILGHALAPAQARILLYAPCHIDDISLARAASIARQLQSNRATARRTCQHYMLNEHGSTAFHAKLTAFLNECLTALGTEEESEWNEY